MNEQLAGAAVVVGVAWYATRSGSGAPSTGGQGDEQQQDEHETVEPTLPDGTTDQDVYDDISGIDSGSSGGGLL